MRTLDLLGGGERAAIQEAAVAGLRGMEHLISQLSRAGTGEGPPLPEAAEEQRQVDMDCREIADLTVSRFKKAISMLNRTGHARFRRGPPVVALAQSEEEEGQGQVVSEPAPTATPSRSVPVTLDFTKPVSSGYGKDKVKDTAELSLSVSGASSSFLSSVTGEGSVSNGRAAAAAPSSLMLPPPPGAASCGRPLPLSSGSGGGQRRECHGHAHSENDAGGGRCHCSNSRRRRKQRAKHAIRVPAISTKLADIPADEFSWRKYGQKPIKGSPYPRGYYKCSTVRGCPAQKHVERDPAEPSMLIVTYKGEHRHGPAPAPAGGQDPSPAPAPLPELASH